MGTDLGVFRYRNCKPSRERYPKVLVVQEGSTVLNSGNNFVL